MEHIRCNKYNSKRAKLGQLRRFKLLQFLSLINIYIIVLKNETNIYLDFISLVVHRETLKNNWR